MLIKKFVLGALQSNSYLVYNDLSKKSFLIDIGGTELDPIFEFVQSNNLILDSILLTHGHIDHIEGLNVLFEKYPDITVYIGEEDYDFLFDATKNLSKFIFEDSFLVNDSLKISKMKPGDIINNLEIIDAPGHTPGGKVFYSDEKMIMFTGDTIFKSSVGRTDFPGGSSSVLDKTVNFILNEYPENTVLYPGHGEKTTIGDELGIKNFFDF